MNTKIISHAGFLYSYRYILEPDQPTDIDLTNDQIAFIHDCEEMRLFQYYEANAKGDIVDQDMFTTPLKKSPGIVEYVEMRCRKRLLGSGELDERTLAVVSINYDGYGECYGEYIIETQEERAHVSALDQHLNRNTARADLRVYLEDDSAYRLEGGFFGQEETTVVRRRMVAMMRSLRYCRVMMQKYRDRIIAGDEQQQLQTLEEMKEALPFLFGSLATQVTDLLRETGTR
jgi:hypothetical protein